MAIADTVKNFLENNLVEYYLVPHPHTGSSHETAEATHVDEDHIAKGVMVKDEAGYAMIVLPAVYYVEMKHVHKELGRDMELVEESEFARLFPDCEPGAVPPLGPAYHIETFLDEDLTSLANVFFESGDHVHLVHINGDDFKTLFKGVRHGHFCQED